MVDFQETNLERLYVYARHLLTKLPHRSDRGTMDLEDELSLTYYRNERAFEGDAGLELKDSNPVYGATALGTGATQDEKKSPLSEIIKNIKERFGTQFSENDGLLVVRVICGLTNNQDLVTQARTNTMGELKLPLEPKLTEAFIKRSDRNNKIVSEFLSNAGFREVVLALTLNDFYQTANAAVAAQKKQGESIADKLCACRF